MSVKSFFIAVLIEVVLLGTAFFIGRWTKPEPIIEVKPPVVTRDTVYLPYAGEIPKAKIVYRDHPATEIEENIFTAELDTAIFMGGDTLILKQDLEFDYNERSFTSIIDVLIRKADVPLYIDSIKTEFVTIKEVPIDPPFYNTFLFGVISTLITFIAIALAVF